MDAAGNPLPSLTNALDAVIADCSTIAPPLDIIMRLLLSAVLLLVPPLATGNTPVTPLVNTNPVQLVSTPADGVPILGVVNTGDVLNTRFVLVVPVVPVAADKYSTWVVVVLDATGNPLPSLTRVLAAVIADCSTIAPPLLIIMRLLFKAVELFVPPLATGRTPVTPLVSTNPVQLVNTPAEGVPMFGVVSTGDVLNTTLVLAVPVVPVADAKYCTCVVDVVAADKLPDPSEMMTLSAVNPPTDEPAWFDLLKMIQSVSDSEYIRPTPSLLLDKTKVAAPPIVSEPSGVMVMLLVVASPLPSIT